MSRMLFLKKLMQRHIVWATLVFVYTTISLVILHRGSISSPDTGAWISRAKILIGHDFNLFTFYSDINFIVPIFFYTIPIVIFAILISIFNDQWIVVYQFLNLITLFFGLFLYIKIALHLEVRKWLIALSLLVFLISVDYLLWPSYILTDTLFATLVMLAIYTVITGVNKNFRYYIVTFLSSLLLLFSRPSSPPYIAVLLFFSFFPSLSQKLLIKKNLLFRLALISLIAAVFFSIIIIASASGLIENKQLDFYRQFIEQGIVIHDRPETAINYDSTHLGAIKLYIYRLVGFFTPFSGSFSATHNILNGLQLLGCYIITITMFRYSLLDFEKNNNRAKAIALLSTLIAFVAIFQSAVLIDYDWRYRYPLIAPLILLATLIFDNYLNSRSTKSNHKSIQ